MITVEWFDYDMPAGSGSSGQRLRRGKLLQVGSGMERNDKRNMAYVITPAMEHDRDQPHHVKRGDNVILAVRLSYLKVLGVDIPLFDHAP